MEYTLIITICTLFWLYCVCYMANYYNKSEAFWNFYNANMNYVNKFLFQDLLVFLSCISVIMFLIAFAPVLYFYLIYCRITKK